MSPGRTARSDRFVRCGIVVPNEFLARVEHAAEPPRDPLGLAAAVSLGGRAARRRHRQPVERRPSSFVAPSCPRRRCIDRLKTYPTRLDRPEEFDRRCRPKLRAMGSKRLVLRAHFVAEQGVDELDHGRLAAEVQRQRQAAGGRNLVAEAAEDVRIGPAEAIDRLLVVAHEEELAVGHAAVAQGPHQFDLQRVGVLEFIDQQQPGLRGQPLPQLRAGRAGNQVAGADQQVVEIQRRQFGLALLKGVGQAVRDRQEAERRLGRRQGCRRIEGRPLGEPCRSSREVLRPRCGRRRKPLRWTRPSCRRPLARGRPREFPPTPRPASAASGSRGSLSQSNSQRSRMTALVGVSWRRISRISPAARDLLTLAKTRGSVSLRQKSSQRARSCSGVWPRQYSQSICCRSPNRRPTISRRPVSPYFTTRSITASSRAARRSRSCSSTSS